MKSLLACVLLLAGCTTMLPKYATRESVAAREVCLRSGGVWLETQERYTCFRRPDDERS